MAARHRIKFVSEINSKYAPTFCSLQSIEVIFVACTVLSAPPLTPFFNCFAPNNSAASMAASF